MRGAFWGHTGKGHAALACRRVATLRHSSAHKDSGGEGEGGVGWSPAHACLRPRLPPYLLAVPVAPHTAVLHLLGRVVGRAPVGGHETAPTRIERQQARMQGQREIHCGCLSKHNTAVHACTWAMGSRGAGEAAAAAGPERRAQTDPGAGWLEHAAYL